MLSDPYYRRMDCTNCGKELLFHEKDMDEMIFLYHFELNDFICADCKLKDPGIIHKYREYDTIYVDNINLD